MAANGYNNCLIELYLQTGQSCLLLPFLSPSTLHTNPYLSFPTTYTPIINPQSISCPTTINSTLNVHQATMPSSSTHGPSSYFPFVGIPEPLSFRIKRAKQRLKSHILNPTHGHTSVVEASGTSYTDTSFITTHLPPFLYPPCLRKQPGKVKRRPRSAAHYHVGGTSVVAGICGAISTLSIILMHGEP